MIKAVITIRTCYGEATIPVEVLGKGPRPGTACVRALNGLEPFTKNSHGGPYQDNKSIVFIPHLRDVHLENDLKNQNKEPSLQKEIEIQPPTADQHVPADWFLESEYENRSCLD